MTGDKVWFITGCSAGLGRELPKPCSRAVIGSPLRRGTRHGCGLWPTDTGIAFA